MSATRTHKVCTICKESKPVDEFHVVQKRDRNDYVQGRCKPCNKEYMREYYTNYIKTNPDKYAAWYRRYNYKRLYGITPEQYEELLAAQDGVCAICGNGNPGGVRLAVDHDHETSIVRGLLCRPCNAALGLLKEDPALLLRATQYLSQSLN